MSRVLTGAVDIGGTKIQLGIVDEQGTLLTDACFPTDCNGQSAEQAMDRIVDSLRSQCTDLGIELANLQGIGVSCAGPVNVTKGTIENPYTLPGWIGFPLVDYISKASELPVKLENDANGALLGEIFQRDLQDKKVLMITVGTGIGVAFWGEGKLYRSGMYHPEMGHVIVSSEGEECYCGHKGCFESRCSGKAMNERAVQAGFKNFDDLYVKSSQDAKAECLMKEILRDLTNGIWNLNLIFKPDYVVFAGGFSQKYFDLLKAVTEKDNQGKADFVGNPQTLPACENKNSALVGANMLFMKEGTI